MNEEQKAVLAAVARLEQTRSGPIDEYTVARAAGILNGELDGPAYVQSLERARIRQIFDELDERGLLRLERGGYWRPRTSLAGRRALEAPARVGVTATATRTVIVPAGGGAVPDPRLRDREDDLDEREVAPAARAWPTWWPAALRFGDPSSTPLLLGIGAIAAFLLVALITVNALGSGGDDPAPTAALGAAGGTATAGAAVAGAATTGTAGAGALTATPQPGGARSTASPSPRSGPTPTAASASFAPALIIANTDRQGVRVFKTPAGERSFAIPEGEEVEVIGPDRQDGQGNIWKHIRFGDEEGWILEQYTRPAE